MLKQSSWSFILWVILGSGSLSFAEETYLCFSLITHNDEETIWKCLESAKEIADCISICDMGSTDQTKAYIEEFLEYTGLPGKIYQRETQKFGTNKMTAVLAAQKTLKSFGFPLSNSYILIAEPKFYFKTAKKFSKESLQNDAYLVIERSPLLGYAQYSPNLFRSSLSADLVSELINQSESSQNYPLPKYRALTLEELFPETELPEENDALKARLIEESKIQKVESNIELFTQILKEDPTNARALLHLAQAKKFLKHHEEAIALYKKRIDLAGDAEEIWFAKYMIGNCYEEMKSWVHALYWYLEAYQFNPDRAESIQKIATHYRLQGENDLAYIFAKHGLRVPSTDDKTLFPPFPLCDYQFDEEISIAAYYTRYRQEGYAASSDLLLRKDTPQNIRDQGYRNTLFYVQNLNARSQSIRIPLPRINPDSEECYYPMNPSIQKTEDGYKVICRAVNYTQIGAKHFETIDKEGIFRTKNFLLHYDRSFNLLSQNEIVENLPREKFHAFIVQGLEDCRIIDWDQGSGFFCTTFDSNPSGAIQISFCKFPNTLPHSGPIEVEQLVPLKGPDPNRHEKNWLPFLKDGQIHLVYSYDPFIIYKPDLTTGECTTVVEYVPEHDFSHFRGSAAPVPFDEGYLLVIHEVVPMPDYSRNYLHRFVYLDKNFIIKKVSKPFTFSHNGIEFCISMTLDHAGKQLILPVGLEDHEARLYFVDLDEVRSLLDPLPVVYDSY